MQIRRVLVGVSIIAVTSLVTASAVRQAGAQPEHFTALAINTGNFGRPRSDVVDLLVLRWSTPAEKEGLAAAFSAKGPRGLLGALRDIPRMGFIRTPDNVAFSLRFAWNDVSEDGSRRVILATDRPLSLWGPMMRNHSLEYPFTFIELRFYPDGEGEGKLSIAATITVNKASQLIELENYANEPVRLMSVRSEAQP